MRLLIVVVLAAMQPSSARWGGVDSALLEHVELVCRISTVVVNLVMRATISIVVSLAIGVDPDGFGGDDTAEVGRETDGVVDED